MPEISEYRVYYICPLGHELLTIVKGHGYPVASLKCKTAGCPHMTMMQITPWTDERMPEWEWSNPSEDEIEAEEARLPGMQEHFQAGMLLLRPVPLDVETGPA